MRIKIKFSLKKHNQFLPFNYQYPISAWIYKILGKADKNFTNLLHDHGYKLENGKTFKLFTFSKLNFPKNTWKPSSVSKANLLRKAKGEAEIKNSDRMEVWARNAWLTVSFHLPEQSEKFVMGLFKEQKAFIGDKVSGIDMEVESIEALKSEIPKSEKIKIKIKTPVVIGFTEIGKKHEQYIQPMHPVFKQLFIKNLLDKHTSAGGKEIKADSIIFEVTKIYTKTAKQTIKAFTREQTEIRAYYFDFELTAPREIIEIGLNAGFGSMNALGFGFGEVITG